jgi:anti-sigma factor RsiW
VNCDEVQKCLERLIEQRDSGQLTSPVLEHLRDCPACRAKMQTAKAALQVLTHMPQVTPQPGFTLGWQRRVRQIAAAKPVRKNFFAFIKYPACRPVFGTVLLVCCCLAGYRFFHSAAGVPARQAKTALLQQAKRSARIAADTATPFFQLKVTVMGAQVREVRQIIEDFLSSRFEDTATMESSPGLPIGQVLSGLHRVEARLLRRELEFAGATVEVTPEAK